MKEEKGKKKSGKGEREELQEDEDEEEAIKPVLGSVDWFKLGGPAVRGRILRSPATSRESICPC